MVATDKSLTDHGISALMDEDCALYRVLTEKDGKVCHDYDDTDGKVLTADAGGKDKAALTSGKGQAVPAFETVEAKVAAAPQTAVPAPVELASFDTASGNPAQPAAPAEERPVVLKVNLASFQPATEPVERPYVTFAAATDLAEVAPAQATAVAAKHPKAGFYYVIGSFRGNESAKVHMDTYAALTPSILQGHIGDDGRQVFRVVVGPFGDGERKVAYRRIRKAGIADTWAIRVTPKDWSVAGQVSPLEQADAGTLSARDWPGLASFINR